ncbi:threonine dehydrogenase-like Zn-dependent dehydrogenase [Arthrobacter silviterrae]|uniref:Dehydrogenase n=2 Tax=Arthrobacter silviterrae TaxID=2026658 RepID=A0ABX0D532_9MICC|nr:zinc-binding alcohol dehydrogenase [Arthrobacter silviterrae]MDQ0279529.1 threonine dehydrogenase-like Zn-dependent dehydrogenase [Arthrobacter silviterrae]NGN81994.1 dehydrogenase [Arthrobacter silviterrae]
MGGEALAFWLRAPGMGELRSETLHLPGPGEVLVRTLYSGVSRASEALVFRGRVPASQHQAMRAPFQDGNFPGPVKYGYLSVGLVEQGPPALLGRTVFTLFPHQDAYVVPAAAVHVVPDGVPASRAVLAGTVETAVNALWDAAPLVGDRVAVVGAGMVGCAVARLLTQVLGVQVVIFDVDPGKAAVAEALGVRFALAGGTSADSPGASPAVGPESLWPDGAGADIAFHTSGTSSGLQLALDLLAPEGSVVDLSWYGDTPVQLSLGGSFHAGRLAIRSSQVGAVAPARRRNRSTAQRLAFALELLRDPAFDVLLTGTSPFRELPSVMPRLADGSLPALCHLISYGNG